MVTRTLRFDRALRIVSGIAQGFSHIVILQKGVEFLTYALCVANIPISILSDIEKNKRIRSIKESFLFF